jgi:exodeoxyribonuclease V beta subunit
MAAIDPGRHSVIEASAGTGKTHTLMDLALRLLGEGRATLDQILLVTYTEKATGELKDRLRRALEQTSPGDLRPPLAAALDQFDQAPLYTIHGFCQRVLQEYAFENRHDFRAELKQDATLFEPCLREIQRRAWPALYGDRLAAVLQLCRYDGPNWEKRVLRIARQFRPSCQHALLPGPVAEFGRFLQVFEDDLRRTRATLRELAGTSTAGNWADHPWCAGFVQVKHHAGQRGSWLRKVVEPLLQWLADPVAEAQPVATFLNLLQICRSATGFAEHGFRLLAEKLKPEAQEQLERLCPGMTDMLEVLDEWHRTHDCGGYQHQLAVHTVHQVHEHLAGYKRERGWQSFEDLLTEVDKALDPQQNPQAPLLLAALRQRYRYAVVDEFQDTDPLQWRIFKRIFVEDDGPQRLFVVGDPKQAIFAFRGADLVAYQKAGRELCERHGADTVSLDINWRSSPELIAALNRLFGPATGEPGGVSPRSEPASTGEPGRASAGSWFDGTGISYRPVQAADPKLRPWRIDADRTGRAALCLVRLANFERLVTARRTMARFIAGEASRLLLPRSGLVFAVKGAAARPLDASDLCVLVARRREATPVLEALAQAGIPYTFYKQTGLWQSDEAVHLDYVLRALAAPDNQAAFRKALLTRFFRIRPEELAEHPELPANHPARDLFLSWCELAENRRWAALFQTLLEDSGVLFTGDPAGAGRRLANYRHISQALAAAAYAQDLDLSGVIDLLEQRRRRPEDDDSDLQPIETERGKVRIMTIHAAKGLEFPVVFLAGGFTQTPASGYRTYRDNAGNLVFDLRDDDDDAKRRAADERSAEERRLYYVALTRPMFKLYVPHVLIGDKRPRMPGPVVTILAPALERVIELGPPYIETIDPDAYPEKVSGTLSAARATCGEPDGAAAERVPDTFSGELFPDVSRRLLERRIRIRSFTSLHRQAAPAEEPRYVERPPRNDDDVPDALEDGTAWRGPIFGEMLHEIMAEIDFAQVGQAAEPRSLPAAAAALIDAVRRRHWSRLPPRLADPAGAAACAAELARMVWHALHTPLTEVGGPLWQIAKADRLHEVEFHFPESAGPAANNVEERFLNGIIDLVFRKGGRYFLLDWKTNLLLDGYTAEAVRQSMADCDYTRQYRLYLQALARWLRGPNGEPFDCAKHFGGIYYLYVRGLNGKDESAGVYFHQPTVEDLELERVVGRG